MLWLIAVPRSEVQIQSSTDATYCVIHVPEFKIGTLDGVLALSDDLVRLDTACEQLMTKMADTHAALAVEMDMAMVPLRVMGKSWAEYVKAFRWNVSLYRPDMALVAVFQEIAKNQAQLDAAMKSRLQLYAAIKTAVQTMERKWQGNYTVRSLVDIIQPEHVDAMASEYLITLFVAVPLVLERHWFACYEHLAEFVVPRSSRVIARDAETVLVNVTVFRKVQDAFTAKCREERFTVRDYSFEQGKAEQEQVEWNETRESRRVQQLQLHEWIGAAFGETAQDWMHVKVLRACVESVLRYGLPPAYAFGVLDVRSSAVTRVLRRLHEAYGHLGRSFDPPKTKRHGPSQPEEDALLGAEEVDYKNYVWFDLSWQVEQS